MTNQKTYRLRHKNRLNALQRIWRSKNQHKTRAHRLVSKAVASGRLMKPENCEECGNWTNKLHGHHADYSRPLDVVWLCNHCHSKLHGIKEVEYKNYARGENHGRAKLKSNEVSDIRLMAITTPKRAIARMYKVSEKLIRLICQGEIWKNSTSLTSK